MKKYLINRVLRSIFSVIMVMFLSIVLIFSLYPLSKIVEENADIHDTKKNQGEDATQVKILEVLEHYGYINYVSQKDYCMEIAGNDSGPRYQACISRLDSNEDKQNYVKKYRDLGWEEVTLREYIGLDGKGRDNSDAVTRKMVEDGKYNIKEGQFFKTLASNNNQEHPDDYLYEADGKRVVTINNQIYFQKRKNPVSVFWSWLSNIITFDTKNFAENYIQWDTETETYLTENDTYKFEFGFYYPSSKNYESSEYKYVVNEDDTLFNSGTVDVDGKFFFSAGGISTGVEHVEEGKSIFDIQKTVTYKNNSNPLEGGNLDLVVTFDDDSKVNVSKEVKSFLKDDIPLYVGDDNYWYVGNTKTNVAYIEKDVIDFAGNREEFDAVFELNGEPEFIESAANRGYKIQLDEYGAPALTCQGCEYKYKIYFDNKFPYIHSTFVQVSLGESIFYSKGQDTIDLLFDKQGNTITEDIVFPSGETAKGSVSSFHTCRYNGNETLEQYLYNDNYTNCEIKRVQSSMIGTSFIMGIFATLIAYFVGVPIGVLMARYKEKLFDKIAMVYIIIMFSVPALAYIYFFQAIGTKLFDLEVTYEYGKVSTYILPIVSLSLGSIASMMMWTRRYMIDQGNSDYVKFARAKGLSESQIFFKHTLRNAIVPIAHGVPGSIIGAVAGALITEQIYNVPGTGKLMVIAVQQYDNWIAIGLILFYSVLGIISMILGDIVITLVDPRISFVDTGGRK